MLDGTWHPHLGHVYLYQYRGIVGSTLMMAPLEWLSLGWFCIW